MTRTTAPWRAALCLALSAGCTQQAAVPDAVATDAGFIQGALVPITMAGGQTRSSERDLLILADGPAGSAAIGGIGGLVYDLLTRRKD